MNEPTNHPLARSIAQALGQEVDQLRPLHGGCLGEVYLVALRDGDRVVAKADDRPRPQLTVEAYMLRYLAEHSRLPVPQVLHATDRLLVMTHLPGESRFSPAAEAHLAELIAALHDVTGPAFGLERDTLIGLLPQPNPWTDSWIDFFREQRLLHLARLAVEWGKMPASLLRRVQAMAAHLEEWLEEPERPSLIHGDLWTTNVLAQGERITGILDPAIYYAHPEIELAYMQLFHSFGQPFFRRYQELRPIRPGFFQLRQRIYNLYPLLSHVCHFGGGYVQSVERTLAWLGY